MAIIRRTARKAVRPPSNRRLAPRTPSPAPPSPPRSPHSSETGSNSTNPFDLYLEDDHSDSGYLLERHMIVPERPSESWHRRALGEEDSDGEEEVQSVPRSVENLERNPEETPIEDVERVSDFDTEDSSSSVNKP